MSKGGSSTSKVEYPDWIVDPAKRNIQRGENLARLGDIPYMGPDVAALTPRQQAAMASTDSALSAYGMPVSNPNFNSNMPVVNPEVGSNMPTEMPAPKNYAGIPAYSSYDIYQGAVDAFREARPGQAAYRDGFFIDPVTGQMQPPPSQENLQIDARYDGSASGAETPVDPAIIAANQREQSRNDFNTDSLFAQNVARSQQGAAGRNDGYGYVFDDYTGADLISERNPNFGMYGDAYSSLTTPAYDPPGNVISRATGTTSSDAQAGDGACVVATHAVANNAFTPKTKRRAVVWCVKALHGKWWGEAIRRGYQTLGKRKIEQGKAHEHYTEFRNYIDFATGEKRTLIGGIKFAARTTQFFAVGIFLGGR
jgi:hypothetical protein